MAMFFAMIVIFVALLVSLAIAGLVLAYVAYIQQGRDIPRAPRLTDAMRRAAERWKIPTEPAEHRDHDRQLHGSRGGVGGPADH